MPLHVVRTGRTPPRPSRTRCGRRATSKRATAKPGAKSAATLVKLTVHKGASLADPAKLFNSSFEGNVRAIDIHAGETVDAATFKALVRAATAHNAKPARAK